MIIMIPRLEVHEKLKAEGRGKTGSKSYSCLFGFVL